MKSVHSVKNKVSKPGVQGKGSVSKQHAVTSLKESDDDGVKFERRRGETLKSYLERIDVESNERIMEAHRKNGKMSERRKRLVYDYLTINVNMCIEGCSCE